MKRMMMVAVAAVAIAANAKSANELFKGARWIEQPKELNAAAPQFTTTFKVERDGPAEIAICGLGQYVATLNGKPIYFAQLLNTLTVKGGWQFELGGLVQSPGYSGNLRIRNTYANVTAAIQKTLLENGSLVLRLEGNDLLGTAHMNVDSDFGSHTIMQTNLIDTQKVKISIRYNFNAAQSKYRGTGAGADSKARM